MIKMQNYRSLAILMTFSLFGLILFIPIFLFYLGSGDQFYVIICILYLLIFCLFFIWTLNIPYMIVFEDKTISFKCFFLPNKSIEIKNTDLEIQNITLYKEKAIRVRFPKRRFPGLRMVILNKKNTNIEIEELENSIHKLLSNRV